jgi:hypothetical protein
MYATSMMSNCSGSASEPANKGGAGVVVGSLGFAPRSSGDVTRKAPSFSIFWFWLHTDYVGALRKRIRDVCEPSSRESSL